MFSTWSWRDQRMFSSTRPRAAISSSELVSARFSACRRSFSARSRATMHRILIAGMALLLGYAIAARNLCAGAGKTKSLVFLFRGVDRPIVAPDVGVQLDSGPRRLNRGSVLTCETRLREHDAVVEGQVAKVSDLLLDCGEHTFVVKSLDFDPHPQ